MNSLANLNGGFVITTSTFLKQLVKKSIPEIPKPLSIKSVEIISVPWKYSSNTFDICPCPHAGSKNVSASILWLSKNNLVAPSGVA
ncbi:TPA: hypothetical protein VAR31_000954 [Streptococcus agalactiae]|nr:hypothetical protein [Streptococcus agalactiae]